MLSYRTMRPPVIEIVHILGQNLRQMTLIEDEDVVQTFRPDRSHPALGMILFRTFYVFFVVHHASRQVLHVHVTPHPTAEWTAQQISPLALEIVHDLLGG